jgi:S-adenosylmethionine decarboxylase
MANIPQPDAVLGKHAIIDLSGCNSEIIRNHNLIQDALLKVAEMANVTVVGSLEHHFKPQGYTTVLVLEESHLSIHTWPEHNYVSIDLYSCNLQTNFRAVKEFLADTFKATVAEFTVLERGYTQVTKMDARSVTSFCSFKERQ